MLDQVSGMAPAERKLSRAVVPLEQVLNDLTSEGELVLVADLLEDLQILLDCGTLCEDFVVNAPEERFVHKLGWLDIRGKHNKGREGDVDLLSSAQREEVVPGFERYDSPIEKGLG